MIFDPSEDLQLLTGRLCLKVLSPSDSNLVLEYYMNNREYFSRYLPVSPLTENIEKELVEKMWYEFDLLVDQQAIRFYIFKSDDYKFSKIIGEVSISNILLGISMSCQLGYSLDFNHFNNGYMKEALLKIISYIFDELGLHRIEVYIKTDNERSINLIKKLGFLSEGICYKYLKINDKWEDHLRFSLIKF